MAMKEYSIFPKAPGLKPHHQIFVISRTLVMRGLTPLQRYSWHILHPQSTGLCFGTVTIIYIKIVIFPYYLCLEHSFRWQDQKKILFVSENLFIHIYSLNYLPTLNILVFKQAFIRLFEYVMYFLNYCTATYNPSQ